MWLIFSCPFVNQLIRREGASSLVYNICKMMQMQDSLWISSSFLSHYFHHLKFKVWPSQAEAFSQSHKLENLNWNPYKWVETMDKYRLCVNLLNANSGHTGNIHLAHHPSPSCEHSSDTSPSELLSGASNVPFFLCECDNFWPNSVRSDSNARTRPG